MNNKTNTVKKQYRAMASMHLSLLDENAEQFTFQVFHDSDPSQSAKVIHGNIDVIYPELAKYSKAGYGIFVTVNETNGKGRKKGNVIKIRAVWQEADRPGVPDLPVEPHIVIESSPGKFHRYILTDTDKVDEFEVVQKRLVDDYGSDPNAKDRSRVLRLAGFPHQKDPANPFMVRIVSQSNELPLPWDEVKKIFPPVTRKPKAISDNPSKWNLNEIKSALSSLDPDLEYLEWLEVGMALHSGSGGNQEGLDLWDTWSKDGKSYRTGECEYKWRSFSGDGVSIETLFKKANDTGWRWESEEDDGENEKRSATQLIIETVIKYVELFHDPDDTPFARINHDNHIEIWPLESQQFKRWVGRTLYEKSKMAPNKNSLSDAFNVLAGLAIYDGQEFDVYVRVAAVDETYYLDPCRDDWRIIKIEPGKWQMVEVPGKIAFRRTSTMRSLPMPENCSFEILPGLFTKHFNMSEQHARLAIAFMLECLMPDTEYPVMEFTGSPGSGKSTIQEMIRNCIDPNKVNLRAAPKAVEDIFVSAINNHLVSYNNLSRITPGQSDALCNLSTGGGHAGRKFFTNTDETATDVKKPVILNGIGHLAKMPDLIDRLIKISLQPISSTDNKPKKQVMDDFNNDLPKILGAMLDLFSKVLERLPGVELDRLPRMADFAILCQAITQVYKWEKSLLQTYYDNRALSFEDSLESSPAIMAVVNLVNDEGSYKGTVGDLYKAIESRKKEHDSWVRTARGLGEKLRLHTPAMLAVGIRVEFNPVRQKDGYHVNLTKMRDTGGKQHSQRSPRSPNSCRNGEHGEHGEHINPPVSCIHEQVEGEI